MMKPTLVFVTLALAASVARAEIYCNKHNDNDPVPAGSVQTYLKIDGASPFDTRASKLTGAYGLITYKVDLKGYLFTPAMTFYAPVIVWSHGGTDAAKPPCAVVQFFVSRGFVVFAPQRRGESPSTGTPLDTWVAMDPLTRTAVDYTEMQAADVLSAAAYVRTLPYVNTSRVTLMGHSNGGIVSLVANRKVGSGPAYYMPHDNVVDISGGGLGWDNPDKQASLIESVENAMRPVFFLQADNEPEHPTYPLNDLANAIGLPHWAWVYPAVPGATGNQAHNWFVQDPAQVAIWGPDVLNFMAAF